MKNTIDFYNIDDDKLGTVNFNNMIPVKEEYCEVILLYKDIISSYNQQTHNKTKNVRIIIRLRYTNILII